MKYAVWFVRFIFAAWMIPAGLNHFVPLFPQPMGNQPLSMELIVALLDSHLFDLVKAVELVAGVMVLFGLYTPLALLICLPVSFGVFYWDAPLEGWGSGAARFGYATLLCNSLLCLAYYKSYQSLFTLKARVSERIKPVMIGRLVLGAILVLFAANILFLSPAPMSDMPLAGQLMTSLVNSKLLYVALVLQLVAGVLLLAGLLVPLALTVQLAISSNALFWALFLNQGPLLAALTLAVFAVNGLLMLAYLPYYRGVLSEQSLAFGETAGKGFDDVFTSALGNTARSDYLPALGTVVVAFLFYGYVVGGRTAEFCMLMLVYPLFILMIRRFRDMDHSPWLLFAPLMLVLLAFDVQLDYFSLGDIGDGMINQVAIAITVIFMIWGGIGNIRSNNPAYG